MNISDLKDISAAPSNLSELQIEAPKTLDDLRIEEVGPEPGALKEEPGFVSSIRRGLKTSQMGFSAISLKAQDYQAQYLEEVLKGGDPKEVRKRYPSVPVEMERWSPDAMRNVLNRRKGGVLASASNIMDKKEEQDRIPQEPGFKKLSESKSLSEFGKNLIESPVSVFSGLIGESLGGSLLTLPAVVAGGVVGGIPGAVAGTGASSAATDYATGMVEILSDMKVDMKDANAVINAIRSPEFSRHASARIPRAIVVGAADALAAKVSMGKALFKNPVGNVATKSGIDATLGMAGEAGGQLVEGKPMNINDILMEGLGGLPGAVKDMTIGTAVDSVKGKITETKAAEKKASTEKLIALKQALEEAKQAEKLKQAAPQEPPVEPSPIPAGPLFQEAKPTVEGPPPPVTPIPTSDKPNVASSYDVWETPPEQQAILSQKLTEQIDQRGSIAELAQFLATEGPTERYRTIAERALQTIKVMEESGFVSDVRFADFTHRAPGTGGIWTGNVDEASILFNKDQNPSFQTALHELVHAVTFETLQAVEANQAYYQQHYPDVVLASQDLNQILDDVKDVLSKADKEKLPAVLIRALEERNNLLENRDELLAWGLSNSAFQRWLDTIPFSGGKRFISRFVDILHRLFRIKKEDQSAFNRLLGIYDRLTVEEFVNDVYENEESQEKSFAEMVDKDPTDFSHDPVSLEDLKLAQRNAETLAHTAAIYNGVESPVSPYPAIFAQLQAKAKDHTVSPATAETIMSFLGGVFTNATTDIGPWAVIQKTGEVPVIVPLFDNRKLFTRISNVYKNVQIMTPFEAEYLLSKGKTTKEAYAAWKTADAQRDLLEKMETGPRGKPSPNLTEFDDETDPEIAKEKLLKEGKDLKQNLTDYVSGGTTTKAVMTNNPVIKWLRYALHKSVAAQASLTATRIAPLGNMWKRMSSLARTEAMEALLLGDEEMMAISPMMLKQAGFSDEQAKFINMMYETDRFLFDKWNNARTELGMKPVHYRPGHFPGRFVGDYQVVASVGDKVVGVITANSRIALSAHIKEMGAQFPGMTVGPVQAHKLAKTPFGSVNLWDAYEQIAQIAGDDAVAQQFRDASERMSKAAQDATFGFNKHSKEKKVVFGSEGRKPWISREQNAKEAFEMFVQYTEQGIMHHELLPVLNDMNKLITDPRMRTARPKTVRYLESLYHHIARREPLSGEQSGIGKGLHSLGTAADSVIDVVLGATGYLGFGPSRYRVAMAYARSLFSTMTMGVGNVAFSLLQYSQLPIFAGPMAVHFRSQYNIDFAQARAVHASASMGLANYFLAKKAPQLAKHLPRGLKIDPEIEMAMKYAEDNNLINFADIDAAIEATTSPAAAQTDFVLNFNQRIAESTTRPYAFLWFYQIARAGGASTQEALSRARNATQFVMVNYRSEERPMMYSALGSLGGALGQLKTFAHSAVAQNVYWLKNAPTSPKAALYMGVMIFAVLGVEAAPGYDMLDELVKYFNTKRIGKPDGLREFMMENNAEWINKGLLSYTTNIDFQARLRMPQFLDMNSFFGNFPAINFFKDVAKTAKGWADESWNENAKKAFQYQITPNTVWLKGTVAEKLYGSEGYLWDKSGSKKYEMTPRDFLLRKWGIRSVTETRRSERLREGDEDTSFQQKRIKSLEEKLVKLIRNNQMSSTEYDQTLRQYIDFGYDEERVIQKAEKEFQQSIIPALERKIGEGNTVESARKEQNYNYHK